MRISINGERKEIEETQLTITRLLDVNKVESPDMVSVQLNGTVIDRALYGSTPVAENDEIEFLYFMGGGSR